MPAFSTVATVPFRADKLVCLGGVTGCPRCFAGSGSSEARLHSCDGGLGEAAFSVTLPPHLPVAMCPAWIE